MSHINNTILQEFFRERNMGAYVRDIEYPEGSVIDGIPILSDTFLEREQENKEREELKNWDETEDNDIY